MKLNRIFKWLSVSLRHQDVAVLSPDVKQQLPESRESYTDYVESTPSVESDNESVESTPSLQSDEEVKNADAFSDLDASRSIAIHPTRKIPKLNLDFISAKACVVNQSTTDSTVAPTGDCSNGPESGAFDIFESAQYPAYSYRSATEPVEMGNSEEVVEDPYAPASILYRAECRVSMTPREVSHCLVGYKDWPISEIEQPKLVRWPNDDYFDEYPSQHYQQDTVSLVPSFAGWVQQTAFSCCWSR